MSDTSATVEVLTAEVRTLMVGKRQVTMSVYKQLDCVEDDVCEPFGRVTFDDPRYYVWVVGRDKRTGVLVRSKRERPMSPEHWSKPVTSPPEMADEWCVPGPRRPRRIGRYDPRWTTPAVIAEDGDLAVVWEIPENATVDETITPGDWTFASPDARRRAEEIARETIEMYRRDEASYREWKELPLIVLAGLR